MHIKTDFKQIEHDSYTSAAKSNSSCDNFVCLIYPQNVLQKDKKLLKEKYFRHLTLL